MLSRDESRNLNEGLRRISSKIPLVEREVMLQVQNTTRQTRTSRTGSSLATRAVLLGSEISALEYSDRKTVRWLL